MQVIHEVSNKAETGTQVSINLPLCLTLLFFISVTEIYLSKEYHSISPSTLSNGREIRNLGDSGNLKMKGTTKFKHQSC